MKLFKILLSLTVVSALLLTSCINNNKKTNESNETGATEKHLPTDLAVFSDPSFKNIIANTLNIFADNITYGDLAKITGLSINYYAEKIPESNSYKDVCNVVVMKDGFYAAFDKYYSVPADERVDLESPDDYSFSQVIDEFKGYNDIGLLTNLTTLSFNSDYKLIEYNPVEHFTNLKKLENLTFYNYVIPNLELFVNFPELRELSVGINLKTIPDGVKIDFIDDLTPLKSLTKLENLSLSGNIVSDLSPLVSLKNLEILSVNTAALTDISPVEHLKNLTSVTFYYNGISDITPLSKLPKLKYISLDYNYIMDISPFSQLDPTVVEYVSLDMNPIEDTTPLRHLGEDKVNFGFDPHWDVE